MRAALLIVLLLLGCLGAIPRAVALRGSDEIQRPTQREAVVLARGQPGDLLRIVETKRPPSPPFYGTVPPFVPLSARLDVRAIRATNELVQKTADRAHALFVLIGPRSPRAPPPARA